MEAFHLQAACHHAKAGFNCHARIMMISGVPVHMHDGYIAGTRWLHGTVLSLVTVVDMADTPISMCWSDSSFPERCCRCVSS